MNNQVDNSVDSFVDKHVDKYVNNYADKQILNKDNPVINQSLSQNLDDTNIPTWAILWSGYLPQINTHNHRLSEENQSLVGSPHTFRR